MRELQEATPAQRVSWAIAGVVSHGDLLKLGLLFALAFNLDFDLATVRLIFCAPTLWLFSCLRFDVLIYSNVILVDEDGQWLSVFAVGGGC